MTYAWQSDIFLSKDRVGFLLEKAILSDVKFSFPNLGNKNGPDIIHAHKLILASASPVFHQMFYGDLEENTEKPIEIVDFDFDTFSIMLKYIYTDSVKMKTWETAANVYGVARKYLLNAFKDYCIDFITEKLEAAHAIKIYEFAKFYEEEGLMDTALKIIRDKTLLVIQSPDFLEISMSTLMLILEQDKLQANELELFYALDSLAVAHGVFKTSTNENSILNALCAADTNNTAPKANCLYSELRQAVKKINFVAITADQFSSGPAFSQLLFGRESAAILACLVQRSNIQTRYPKHFSKNVIRVKRLPHVFFDVAIDDLPIGRIIVELRADVVPKTIEVFLTLCYGSKGSGFEGALFDNIKTTNSICSVKALKFKNKRESFHNMNPENFTIKHTEPGTVALMSLGRATCVSWFYIITSTNFELKDNQSVVIGAIVGGMEVIKTIRTFATESGIPSKKIIIKNCGKIQHPVD